VVWFDNIFLFFLFIFPNFLNLLSLRVMKKEDQGVLVLGYGGNIFGRDADLAVVVFEKKVVLLKGQGQLFEGS